MENEGDEDRKLPPGIWGLLGEQWAWRLGGVKRRVANERWVAGKGSRRQRREPRAAAGKWGEALGWGQVPTPEAWKAATPGPELLSIFLKQTKKVRNHNLACDEDSESK